MQIPGVGSAMVVNGIARAVELLGDPDESWRRHLMVEVMACEGGCLGGGGEPKSDDPEILSKRARAIYAIDAGKTKKKSHQNAQAQSIDSGSKAVCLLAATARTAVAPTAGAAAIRAAVVTRRAEFITWVYRLSRCKSCTRSGSARRSLRWRSASCTRAMRRAARHATHSRASSTPSTGATARCRSHDLSSRGFDFYNNGDHDAGGLHLHVEVRPGPL